MVQYNLGNALTCLGERESGTARLEEAVSVYRQALGVFEAAQADYHVNLTNTSLQIAEALLSTRRK
jgi:hypothetical protein